MTLITTGYRTVTWGRDCMGNVRGYRVVRGAGFGREVIQTFTASACDPDACRAARAAAQALCDQLNAEVDTTKHGG